MYQGIISSSFKVPGNHVEKTAVHLIYIYSLTIPHFNSDTPFTTVKSVNF